MTNYILIFGKVAKRTRGNLTFATDVDGMGIVGKEKSTSEEVRGFKN